MQIFPRAIILPFVTLYSSRICENELHPAETIAGVMNFVRISISDNDFLSKESIFSSPTLIDTY